MDQNRISALVCLGVCLWPMATFGQSTVGEQPGIVQTQPDSTWHVDLGGRFLVPYEETIPGTELTFTMLPIPGGEFLMGSPDTEAGRAKHEGPQMRVELEPFWMAQCEVTWAEYKRFMEYYDLFKQKATSVTAENQADAVTAPTPLYDPSFTYALGEEPKQPAVTMTQYAAKQYSKWLSLASGRFYRLPAEAEWEYACRAGSQARYSWGEAPDTLDEHAWYYDNSDDMYHDVGGKKPNAWGLHDMHGNVAEYVLDELGPYQDHEPDSPLSLTSAIRWPDKLFGRVIRGGSWQSDPEQLRCAHREGDDDWRIEDPNLPKSPWWFTDERALCVGFRLVRPLSPPPLKERNRFWDADVEEIIEDVDFRVSEGRGVRGIVESEE